MPTSNYIPLNQYIAVSPRFHKFLLHACRILDMSLEQYLHCNLTAEIRALRDEIQANIKSARRDAYFMAHLNDPPPSENDSERVDVEVDLSLAKKIEMAAEHYGITPERFIELTIKAHVYA